MFKKLEGRIKKNKRKTIELYSSLVAGIVTGGAVGSVFPNFILLGADNWISNWIINFLLVVFFLLIFYIVGRWAIRNFIKDHSEDRGYHKNFITGVIASIYIILMLIIKSVFGKSVLIGLSIVALIILLHFYTKPRRRT